ncbi:MAG: hypothetical protein ACOCYB_01890 [Alkalispirochaeta sp.]
MRQYYYTVASLPALTLEEQPFLTQDDFLENCAVELDRADLAYVTSARIRLEGDQAAMVGSSTADFPGVAREWNRALREFQQQAAILRAQNLGWEAERLPRPDMQDAVLPDRLRQILNEETPLKQELGVLRWLWAAAESLETGHHFDREKLFLYHLKLQIALRRTDITDSDAGNEEFDRQYNVVAESLMEIAT